MKKTIICLVTMLFLLNPLLISLSNAEGEAVPFITLPDGTTITMTSAQLSALAACPGVAILASPDFGPAEVAIPIPDPPGGGDRRYIVGTPEAIASCLNSTGMATGIVASSIIGATAAAGVIPAGALAGTVATLGTGGTVAAGAAVVGAGTGLLLLSTGGGGGNDGGGGPPPGHTVAPAHQ
jgi:hypothetical protein